ncbi:MAG: hypothetical protein A2747_02985 [Candidatus Yonathbacteria bacterium RIFCSPHIGHO2_01_FULL_44_41]|uniref:General secretion pathway GspH domain-containing protein n=1 Tax=Candidatus Yonathbacteria bacterium RIFCSPHIGHO2_02_FULL_44_14 TaxID=1802724 RepID=A0A1G2S756_9BACT|nr:MAG: hypothetical protein A2747_02985 [Candidatus Yonathbacteria bacterium RIFCSPHIGHO2_01_FULL_44_41]OHA80529.1 MAG: hypothetical protein A3D51_00405 [Candidatus Yonathbacteria bacterium RIFCSPHIGHO2_02_FULL_44_14]OHA82179.1 MAG: hypothetical protein A3B06_01590 [Candidatus Yonathbacteria bacterium RIFCSPLOWO2_01_FULL_43_20]
MNKHPQQSLGFTLVELLVTVGVFVVLTSVVLANYRGFDTNAKFANASEDIVLAIRQAQVYGVGVKGEGASFTIPYGVYLKQSTPNQILLFADRDAAPDGKYTTADNPIVETINWQNVITSLSISCDGGPCGGNELSVTFRRPNVDAVIKDGAGTVYSIATVTITKGTKTSIVTISRAGQVSIQ